MVPQDAPDLHAPDDVHALVGVRIITHDVSQAHYLIRSEDLDSRQHGLQGLEICMDVCYDSGTHGETAPLFPDNSLLQKPQSLQENRFVAGVGFAAFLT